MGNLFSSKCPPPPTCPVDIRTLPCPEPPASAPPSQSCKNFTADENTAICNFMNNLYDANKSYTLAGSGAEVVNEAKKLRTRMKEVETSNVSLLLASTNFLDYKDSGLLFNQALGVPDTPGETSSLPFPPLIFANKPASAARLNIIKLFDSMFTLTDNKYKNSPVYAAAIKFQATPAGDGCIYRECGGYKDPPPLGLSTEGVLGRTSCPTGEYYSDPAKKICTKCPPITSCNGTGLVPAGNTGTEGFQNLFDADNSKQWTLFTNLFFIGTIIYLFMFIYANLSSTKRRTMLQIPMIISGLAVIVGIYQATKYSV